MEGLAKVPKLYQPGPDAQTSALIFPRLKVDPFRKLPWQSDESWASRDSDAAVLTNNNMHRGSTSLWHLWHPELKGKSCTDSGSRLPVIQGCSKRMESQLKYYCNVASTYDSGTPVKMQYDAQVHLCSFLKSRVGPEGFQTGEYTCSCSLWYFTDHFQSWNQFINNKKE